MERCKSQMLSMEEMGAVSIENRLKRIERNGRCGIDGGPEARWKCVAPGMGVDLGIYSTPWKLREGR